MTPGRDTADTALPTSRDGRYAHGLATVRLEHGRVQRASVCRGAMTGGRSPHGSPPAPPAPLLSPRPVRALDLPTTSPTGLTAALASVAHPSLGARPRPAPGAWPRPHSAPPWCGRQT